MRSLLVAFALISSVTLSAQSSFLISNFTTAPGGSNFTTSGSWAANGNQLITANGILSIAPVSGGNPDDSGNFGYADLAQIYNATLVTHFTVEARIDAGNFSNGFIVNLFDSQGIGALTATFNASSFNSSTFTAVSSLVSVHSENGVRSDIAFFGIAGVGTSSAFRFSFDSISAAPSAIPEPSTYAAIFGALALGFVAYRRRMARA